MVRVLEFHVAAGVSSLEDLKREKLNILLRGSYRVIERRSLGMDGERKTERKTEALIDSRRHADLNPKGYETG